MATKRKAPAKKKVEIKEELGPLNVKRGFFHKFGERYRVKDAALHQRLRAACCLTRVEGDLFQVSKNFIHPKPIGKRVR
jgi:hypothetical protein